MAYGKTVTTRPAKKYATPKSRVGRYVARRLRRILCKLGRHGPWLRPGDVLYVCETCGEVFIGPLWDGTE